jgi:para-nitrobenzyl esterase
MPPQRSTRAGAVEGVRLGAVDAFLGIPYAAPPVGPHRWRAPQPPTPWAGVRLATRFGPSCWQAVEPKGFDPWTSEYVVQGDVSEDCLTLNVWAPADAAGESKPVLVWIHGGAFCQGSGSVPIYDGRALASQGVVVVTINYRIGVLGFLAHPDLARESGASGACGNFGLQDQIAALRWVQANIAAFGGDPDAVTVAGQSAGAVSVHMLVSSPLAAGHFHRAIAQSGPPTLVPIKSREQAEADGLALAAELRQPDVQALRALSVQELTRTLAPGPRFGPIVDGVVLPSWPPQSGLANATSNVPMIVGQTADENSGLDPDYGSADPAHLAHLMQRYFGDQAPQMSAHYLQSASERVDVAYRAASLDRWLTALWQWADHRSRQGCAPMFAYLFEHIQPGPDAARYGAFHTSEVPYALATLDAAPQRPFTDIDRKVCAITSSYWLNFVKNGNPNGQGLPHWPQLDPGAPLVLRIDERVEPADMFAPSMLAIVRNHVGSGSAPTILQ